MKTKLWLATDKADGLVPCEMQLEPVNQHRIYQDGVTKEWYIRAVFAVGPMPVAVERQAEAKGRLIDNASAYRNALCELIEQCHLHASDVMKETPLGRATKRARAVLGMV